MQSGKKRGRAEDNGRRSSDRGGAGGRLSGAGSVHSSQDSLSVAGSQAQRSLAPELEQLSAAGSQQSLPPHGAPSRSAAGLDRLGSPSRSAAGLDRLGSPSRSAAGLDRLGSPSRSAAGLDRLGSQHDSLDSFSLAGQQESRKDAVPELGRASPVSEDGTAEGMGNGQTATGLAGSGALPGSQGASQGVSAPASSTSSLFGNDGGRIRLTLSFDGARPPQHDSAVSRDRSAAGGTQGTVEEAQHGSAGSQAALSQRNEQQAARTGGAEGPVSKTGKPADTARRKGTADEGTGRQQRGTTAAVDGAVLKHSLEGPRPCGHAHLDSVPLPDGAVLDGHSPRKKHAPRATVDVHASAEHQSSRGRKAAVLCEERIGRHVEDSALPDGTHSKGPFLRKAHLSQAPGGVLGSEEDESFAGQQAAAAAGKDGTGRLLATRIAVPLTAICDSATEPVHLMLQSLRQ